MFPTPPGEVRRGRHAAALRRLPELADDLMPTRYDTLVIGGGMSGLPMALRAARHGRTAFVESGLLGGTCLNRGCIPTKAMIASAKVAHQVRRAADFGVATAPPRVDLGHVVDRKDEVVDAIRSGSYRAVGKSGDLDLIEDHGRFTATHRLHLSDGVIEADRIFLSTGTRTLLPPIDGLGAVDHLTSTSVLDLRELPGHLIVVGGGFVGVEFAQMFARFGSKLTVVQRAERLVPAEDPEVSAVLAEAFATEGIDVLLSTSCVAVDGQPGAIRVACEGAETTELVGTHLLLATGRAPNTDDLGLEHLGVEPDGRGFMDVDDRLHTDAEDAWALGDLRETDMFTHTARVDSVKAALPGLVPETGSDDATPRGTASGSVETDYGTASVSPSAPGPLPIHRMARTMWLPMLVMGAMALIGGLILSAAASGQPAGSEAARELFAWTQGTAFLGEGLILAGISFLLGTILAGLREGGGEVQEFLGVRVETLEMPKSAKAFVVLMMLGLMTVIAQFVLYIVAAGAAGDATASAAWAAWLGPFREVALGTMLAAIVLALYTISRALGFQFSRIRALISTGA